MGDEKESIFDMVDPDILKEADIFIEELMAGKIKRMVEPSLRHQAFDEGDYDDDRALEKMKVLNRDPENEQRAIDFYKGGRAEYYGDNGR